MSPNRPIVSQHGDLFQAIVESAPNAIVMVDAGGRIALVNAQAESLFGYPRAEMVGQPVELLVPGGFHADHSVSRDGYAAPPMTRRVGAGRDLYARRKDGSEVAVEIGLSPIPTPEGQFVLAAVVDITERRRAQQALERRSEEVEAFVYIVSHDLRAPLVNLQGFSRELTLSAEELGRLLASVHLPPDIAARADEILREEIPSSLRYMSASTYKFERMINALLGLSRSGRQEYRYEQLDMRALVQTTLDSVMQIIGEKAAEVVVGEMPPAWGDRTAVEQVFSNLIGNALTYLDPARRGRIEVGGTAESPMNSYWVKDNGLGISAAAQGRLLQVFQRFHPGHAAGEGMGLAIVKRVVERHGGRVWVESAEGVGATFHVTLPACEMRKE